MSLAVLNQVYDETRRLAIAGSSLAAGDFRLKKLIPTLEGLAAKAPVFGKVATAVRKLVDSSPQESSAALLELSTLVLAIRYTQGETGIQGSFTPFPSGSLPNLTTSTSSRLLRSLIDALTTTGSGRLETIQQAHARDAFDDLRLVMPALQSLDDPYPEIADFLTDHILPRYGLSVYESLKSNWKVKGKGGHLRRLRLMHQLDPDTTRPLALQALQSGSKEMKVAAIGCLGSSSEDFAELVDLTKAKNKEVRAAALQSIAEFQDEQVVDILINALSGRDLELAGIPASKNKSPRLLEYLLEKGAQLRSELFQVKERSKHSQKLDRFYQFTRCFSHRRDPATIQFLSDCFQQRQQFSKLRGDFDGQQINLRIAELLVLTESKKELIQVVDAHSTLDADVLVCALVAATRIKTAKDVYDLFSPYVVAKKTRKRNDPVNLKREAIQNALHSARSNRTDETSLHIDVSQTLADWLQDAQWDDRWLDTAVTCGDLHLVSAFIRPGHAAATKWLTQTIKSQLAKKTKAWETAQVLDAMIRAEHPDVVSFFLQALKKEGTSNRRSYHVYWLAELIFRLPADAVSQIEQQLADLPESVMDEVVSCVSEYKLKQSQQSHGK